MRSKLRQLLFYSIFIQISFFNFLYANNIYDFSYPIKKIRYKNLISKVLKKNLNIKIAYLEKKSLKFEITKQWGDFDPILDIEIGKDLDKSFSVENNSAETTTTNYYNLHISKKFTTGTNIDFYFLNNREKFNGFYKRYNSELNLTINQPILKNFGITVNKSEILKAANFYNKKTFEIKRLINDTIFNAIKDFLKLYYLYEKLHIAKESLQLAKNTHYINKEKVKVGMESPLVLQESKAEISKREQELIEIKKEIINTSNLIKKYYDDVDKLYIIEPEYNLKINPIPFKLDEAIKLSLDNRYELKEINFDIKNSKIDILKSKNQIYPSLDLELYGSLTGEDKNYDNSIKRLKSGKYHKWGVGLKFNYPLNNSYAKSQYKQEIIRKEKLLLTKKEIKNQIITEVQSNFNSLVSLAKEIIANEKSLEDAKIKLDIENKKYLVGKSTLFKLFSYQVDYINEKVNLIESKVNYEIKYFEFLKSLGFDLFNEKFK